MTERALSEIAEELFSAFDAAYAPSVLDSDAIEALRAYGQIKDRLDALSVRMIAELERRGVFAAHNYHRPQHAVAQLLGWDQRPARRRVELAEQVCPRVGLDGQELPARLPSTGAAFADGVLGVAQAEAIAAVLNGPAAARLHPDIWAGAEEQIAAYAAATRCTPNEIRGWARQLIDALDQDGAEPGEPPEQPNELRLSRKPCGTGGWIRGELDGPTFEAVWTAIDALSKPLPDVKMSLAQRQAHALGEICGFTMRHDSALPDTGGERPQIRVTVDFEKLLAAVSGAHLDTGAWYSATQLRALACDACVIPAVLGSAGEPLDIGRVSRTIPAGIRRAVAIRDGGCSYPGCNRPPVHCEVHHCREWVDGGDTALHNCTMLCKAHHLIVHRTGWTV